MKNLLFSLFAIGVAAVAAMTATTAMLNAPHRTVAPAIISASSEQSPPSALADTKPAAAQGAPPAAPANSAGAKPASGTAAAKDTKDTKDDKDEEGDKDPYEGIAPEEIPPDMQYSADSSVSFPTNI